MSQPLPTPPLEPHPHERPGVGEVIYNLKQHIGHWDSPVHFILDGETEVRMVSTERIRDRDFHWPWNKPDMIVVHLEKVEKDA